MNGSIRKHIYRSFRQISKRHYRGGGISWCVKAEKHDLGVIMADVNVIGSLEAKFESTNRIYGVGGGGV
nr:MAG TPA: hypothetical protein [Caudoviricetes sp.]